MAIAYQSAGTQDYTTSSASASPGAPAGVVSGDLLVLGVMTDMSGFSTTDRLPSVTGWTKVGTHENANNVNFQQHVFWRKADGTADDTPTVTATESLGSIQAGIIRIDGQHATAPLDDIVQGHDDSRPIAVGDLTVAEDGSLAVAVVSSYLTDDGDCTGPVGYTQRSVNGSGEDTLSILTADIDSGTGGGGDFTFASGLRYCYHLISFSPAAVSGVTGTAASSAPPATQSASGTTSVTGTAAQDAPSPTQALAGSPAITGTVAQTAPAPTQSATGGGITGVTGSAASVAPSPTQALAGSPDITGTAAQSAPSPTQSAVGTVEIKGTIAQASPMPTQAAAEQVVEVNIITSNFAEIEAPSNFEAVSAPSNFIEIEV